MSNYLGKNIGINIVRQSKQKGVEVLVNKNISNRDLVTNHTYNFPLYLYSEKIKGLFEESSRTSNLNIKIVNELAEKLQLAFTNEKEQTKNTFAPIDILDYIYAVLHSPTYREKYKEFLKIDFPRVPYPKDQTTFWQLVKLGKEIREVHLLESEIIENYITSYPETGDNVITRKLTKTNIGYEPITDTTGKVWINDIQYFNNVPLVAWEFYIGGYQPAQKWLKDRKDRELSFEDILHYQKIIVALTETHRIMQEIDTIKIED
jgi:predicted helicase